jgi:hypothetical protein
MSLRGEPITETTTLPDGREAVVWVGVLDDPYIDKKELETVALELRVDGEVAATLNTVLDVDQDGEARDLAREVAAGLASGELDPTAHALEPLADEPR